MQINGYLHLHSLAARGFNQGVIAPVCLGNSQGSTISQAPRGIRAWERTRRRKKPSNLHTASLVKLLLPHTHHIPTLYPPRLIPGGQSKPSSPGEWAQPSPNDTSPDLPQLKASRKQLESHCAQPGQRCTGRRTEVPHDGSSPARSLSPLVTIIPKEEENLGL